MPDRTDRQTGDVQRQLEEERRRFVEFVAVAKALNSTLNIGELLQLIMTSAQDLVGAEQSSLLLLDQDTGELVFQVVAGDPAADVVNRRVPPGEGVAGWALQHGEAVVIDDAASDPRFYAEIGQTAGVETRSLLAVPLKVKDKAIGVVELINKRGDAAFSPADLDLARALADLAAIAIDNASMYARLADAVVSARLSYRL